MLLSWKRQIFDCVSSLAAFVSHLCVWIDHFGVRWVYPLGLACSRRYGGPALQPATLNGIRTLGTPTCAAGPGLGTGYEGKEEGLVRF